LLINDQERQVFYILNTAASSSTTFSGMGAAAAWTSDSKTLYIVDSESLGGNHKNAFYVFNSNTGFTSCAAGSACAAEFTGAQSLPPELANLAQKAPFKPLAVTIPSVGAYLAGDPTVSRTWCPAGTVGNLSYYPQGDSVNVRTDVLAATTDGDHILGATANGGGISLADIGVSIPKTQCPGANSGTLSPLSTGAVLLGSSALPGVTAAADVNQIIPSPASNLSFITYTPQDAQPNNQLPYYLTASGAAGTKGDVTLMNGSSASTTVTAPIAGAFSPDDRLFFVSTAGDNLLHTIDVNTLTDTQQFTPNLPACTPIANGGLDPGCTYTGSGTVVPATVITVKPRSTT
jgi:trimeric autotransporter adhesin